MQKKPAPHSAIISIRLVIAVALCSVGASIGWLSFASTPPTSTIDPANPVFTYTADQLLVPNQSPLGLGQLDSGPRCNSTFPCDSHTVTVNLPAGFVAQNNCAAIKVTMYWTDTGSGKSDYDLYIYDGSNPTVDGSHPAPYSSASGADPEVAVISPLHDGTGQFTIKIVPYQPTAETVHVRMELLSGSGCGGFPNFGGPDPTSAGVPRYQIFDTPAGSTAESTQGEMNIGFDAATGRILTMNSGPIWRLTPPELLAQAKPECCEGLWEDVTNATTITGVDPILWGDRWTDASPLPAQPAKGARMFAANSTAGTNGVYGFSDDDGDTWLPLSASPPNASSDHETIGSGPYPASLSTFGTPANHGHAVYYCAQTFPTGAAACQRSDTYGASYGPSTIIYNPNPPTNSQCGGIHGHVHVGPDGTAYVPVRDCGGNAGLVVSTDGGLSWTEHVVPNSTTQTHGSDPSIAIGANNTIYFFYVKGTPPNQNEGHVHVQVSNNHGATWSKDTDLGVSHGVVNAVFPEAVAGDDNRAACGFLGTDKPGFYEGITFPGFWYLFIATTYDGGNTWKVVNATPNDPVQGLGGIWQGGGSNPNRNLLDFNEVTTDDKGRVLFGYDDGCVDECLGDPTHNSFGARIRVARQIGGKGLLSQFDPAEPAAPKRACLSGARDTTAAHLTWKVPDNNGADITNYQIFRGTSPGGETLIGQTGGPKPSYTDTTADPAVAHYYYEVKAINSSGTGLASNEIDLVAVPPPPVQSVCVLPGLTKLTDPAGDTSAVLGLATTPAPPGSDLLSLQLAQPYESDGVPRLVFTLNTDPGQSPQPAGSSWYVAIRIPDPPPATTYHYKAVHMTWNGTTPVFESYTPSGNSSGGVDGRFVTAGSQKPAEPGSSYNAPFNQVVIVVKASDLGLNPGDSIGGFVAGVSQTTNPVGTGPAATALYDQMPDSLAFAGSYTLSTTNTCSAPGFVSRKTHGSAGEFDVVLPATGNAGIECRSGGANGLYTLVYSLDKNVAVPGTAVKAQGTAVVGMPTIGPNPNQISINLRSVANAQHLVVTLSGVKDVLGATLNNLTARMDVLVADADASGRTDSGDVTLVRQQSLQPVTGANFREDLDGSGRIDSADVTIARQQTITVLPADTTEPAGRAASSRAKQ